MKGSSIDAPVKLVVTMLIALVLSGCSHVSDYLHFWKSQNELKNEFLKDPSASLLNELNPEGSFLLLGRVVFLTEHKGPLLVVAVTDKFKRREIVTTRIVHAPVEFYQAYLPEGRYDLYFLADLNGNGYFDADEVVGKTSGMPIQIDKTVVRDGLTIEGPVFTLDYEHPVATDLAIKIQVRDDSYVYPSLDDPIFDSEYGRMGLYEPKNLLAHNQRLFFSLEKFDPQKTMVLFVHGVDGTPRDFKYLVDGLDKSRYQPWFYYYPSGLPLQKLGSLLAQTLDKVNKSENFRVNNVIVVAHSMGGLVSLAALDQLCKDGVPDFLKGYISFNSPYGGVAAMKAGQERAPVLVPSWRDVTPGSTFLKQLYAARERQEFPFYLYFGFKTGDSSDGTITLQSQLESKVHFAADKSFGFNATHVGILNDETARQHFYRLLSTLK